MKAFYSYLVAHPKRWLLLLFLITMALAGPASKIRIDSSIETLMLEKDPDRLYFEQVRETFGSDEVQVAALVAKDTIFRPESLSKIQRISEALEDVDGVERVVSLSTVYDIVTTDEGIEVRRLIKEIPQEARALEELKRSVMGNDLFLNTLVSRDGRAAAINAFVEKRPEGDEVRAHVINQLEAIVAQEQGPEEIYLAGVPYSNVMLHKRQQDDMNKFTPLTLLLIAVVLFLSFGSIRGIVIPLVTVGLAMVWTMGVMSLFGKPITAVSTTIPSLLMAIGSAYTIHVLSHYYAGIRKGGSNRESLVRSFADISLPVTVTAVTTLAGFVAIMANRIPAIRDFGMFGILGIAFTCLLSLTLVPALLALMKPKKPGRWAMEGKDSTSGWLEGLAGFNVRNRRAVITISFLLFGIGVLGVSRMEVDTDYMGFLSRKDPVIQNLNSVEQHFAGTVLGNIILEGNEPEILKDPDIIRAVDNIQAYLNQQDWVDKTTSYLDYLKLVYGAISGEEAGVDRLPHSVEEVSQSLLLYSFSDPETLDQLVTQDFTKANIVIRAKNTGSKEHRLLLQEFEENVRPLIPQGLTLKGTGTANILAKTADQIAIGQALSLSIALIIIFFIMSIMFLSFKVGLVSMIPNLIPIGILFGIMGWMGITLNMATSLIAAVALGIAVDDTIHYMTRFHRELKRTYSEKEAMKKALMGTGNPITCTTIALCLGFLILCLSNYIPIIHFGFLTALTIALCLLADLFFLPAVLLATRIITIWDLFLLKMGKDPHKTIPLFEGMRPVHAKILVLMGTLKEYKKEEVMFRRGEVGNEMYVVLSGQVEIYNTDGNREQVLATLSRGEIFGEMGLVRGDVRSASARAKEDTELFLVDAKTLARMQKKYPRLSSRFFLNLSKILSDRLQHRTDEYFESHLQAKDSEDLSALDTDQVLLT